MRFFNTGFNDKDLADLKKVLAKFYSNKAISQTNEIWEQRGLTDEDMDKWLHQKSSNNKKEIIPQFGSAKDNIKMSADFDEPLDDFKEYM